MQWKTSLLNTAELFCPTQTRCLSLERAKLALLQNLISENYKNPPSEPGSRMTTKQYIPKHWNMESQPTRPPRVIIPSGHEWPTWIILWGNHYQSGVFCRLFFQTKWNSTPLSLAHTQVFSLGRNLVEIVDAHMVMAHIVWDEFLDEMST